MKTAVLGVGRMGRHHVRAAQKAGLEVTGIFDTSRDSLNAAREELSLPDGVVFDNLDRLYSVARPECVIVATTADSHCELTCAAAERGAKRVLVEKPMAVSLSQCDRMIETCRRHGTRLAVNHQMRFIELYTEPKRLAATKAFDGFASMTVVAGNMGFSMNAIHYFESFRFLSDEDPVEVSAWFSPGAVPNPRGARFEDRAGSIRAVTAGGRRLYMDLGADQGHGVLVFYACRNGVVIVNELTGEMVTSEREEQYRGLPTTRYGMPAVRARRTIQTADLVDTSAAVLDALLRDQNNVSGEDGRKAVTLVVAAYQSAEHGGVPVRLDDRLNRDRVFPWA